MYTIEIPSLPLSSVVQKIQNWEEIEYAEPNFVAKTALVPHDTHYAQYEQDSIKTLQLEKVWEQTTGSSQILVAVLDTGIDASHEDLQGQISPNGWDFVHGDSQPEDDSGHGTAMVGIIGAKGNNGKGIAGVCWNIQILPLKVADKNGMASFSNLANGITYAADQGAKIINLSLGAPVDSPILHQAVQYAYNKGVVLIGAAGNDMAHLERYPAAYPEVLSVASVGPDGNLGLVTNISPNVDLAAPGEYIWSTIPGNLYALTEGTSSSAAFVSGMAALLLSQNPNLTNREIYTILKSSTRPIPAFQGKDLPYSFGYLDGLLALERAKKQVPDLAIKKMELRPRQFKANQSGVLYLEVENRGLLLTANGKVEIYRDGQLLTRESLGELNIGEVFRKDFSINGGPLGSHILEVRITGEPRDDDLSNNIQKLSYSSLTTNYRDMAIRSLSIPKLDSNPILLKAKIANLGNQNEYLVKVIAKVNGQQIDAKTLYFLPKGRTKELQFNWTPPSTLPQDLIRYELEISPKSNEAQIYNNKAAFDFYLVDKGLSNPSVQYAQKGTIDFSADAPYRISPGRPYLPLLIFIPDKGAKSQRSFVRVESIRIYQNDQPVSSPSGQLIYEDTYSGQPTKTTAGMEIVDEMGKPLTKNGKLDLNLFQDRPIRLRGRHNILRFPRGSLGIPLSPKTTQKKYYSVYLKWKYYRHLFWIFYWVRKGSYEKHLAVRYTATELPSLPGEGHYFDVHHHTIAEWFFAPFYKLLAPKKDFGGPIQMIKENAYAWGITPRLDDVKNKVITTDHNCFYEVDKNKDSVDERPPVGPTSVSQNQKPGGGTYTEREVYRRIFGQAAGEEVAFTHFPIGSHMLVYRAQHFDGNWHAGSIPIIGGRKLPLDKVLGTMAKKNRPENQYSFSYAAHPFSKQGWTSKDLSAALGLEQKYRNYNYVHLNQKEFVFKGLQVFNGRHERSLPSRDVHFTKLNPFINSSWQQGNTNWDSTLQKGLIKWHSYISQTLKWAFNNAPQKKFIRKIYIAGGSDAHGSFNYSDSRLATVIPLQSTFSANSNAWGRVRTYCLGNGKTGTTPALRALKAYEDGNTIVTDGPLLQVSFDSNGYFDSKNLVWHDKNSYAENEDGQIGGHGSGFDGERTALVVKGSPFPLFKYIHENTEDFGSNGGKIMSIKIYRDLPGQPNPTKTVGSREIPIGVGSLQPGQNGKVLVEPIDPNEEGTVQDITAFSFGAFTGGDPDIQTLGVNEYRCYTNPIWVVPVDMKIQVASINTQTHQIDAGQLKVKLVFPISMDGSRPLELAVKQLDQNGISMGTYPLTLFQTQGTGWTSANGVEYSVFEATNTDPIPLSGPQYPQSHQYTFVVYMKEKPRDINGNQLNPIAQKFTVNYQTPTNPVVIVPQPVISNPVSGPSQGGSAGSGGGSSSGGGCTLSSQQDFSSGIGLWIPLLVLIGLLMVSRNERSQKE
ncbi:MAG: peptidase S8 [Planctomycetota bacterium]|nr:MAG: peptidase S8 [Planctomycetota bacterium]